MVKKKVCKNCKRFVEGGECPACKSTSSTNIWKGRIHVIDSDNSEIGQKIGIKVKGEYAIKIR